MHLLYNLKKKTTIIENITAVNYICYYFRCSPLQVCQSDMNSNNNKQHEWMIRKVLNKVYYIEWWHMRPCDITWEDLRPYLVVLSSTFAAKLWNRVWWVKTPYRVVTLQFRGGVNSNIVHWNRIVFVYVVGSESEFVNRPTWHILRKVSSRNGRHNKWKWSEARWQCTIGDQVVPS